MNTTNVDLRAKLDCLLRPATFPDRPASVEAVETHFAWVLLAGDYVYKLKKPLRFHEFDFTTLAARRANCELEVVLNRRLAAPVYVGTVPLTAQGPKLVLDGRGTPVEWLVKMRRLPRERTLDRMAAAGTLRDADLRALFAKLAAFYASAARAPWDGAAYRAALARDIEHYARELAAPGLRMDTAHVRQIAARLLAFVAGHPALFDERAKHGRVVDAHGDLKPEHVFLLPDEPQIIDCLEFSAQLRLLDGAAEVGFLALECERLGHAAVAARLLERYRDSCADDVDDELLGFYRGLRALVRALLAAWHLPEELTATEAAHWRERAEWYLAAAAAVVGLDAASPATQRG